MYYKEEASFPKYAFKRDIPLPNPRSLSDDSGNVSLQLLNVGDAVSNVEPHPDLELSSQFAPSMEHTSDSICTPTSGPCTSTPAKHDNLISSSLRTHIIDSLAKLKKNDSPLVDGQSKLMNLVGGGRRIGEAVMI